MYRLPERPSSEPSTRLSQNVASNPIFKSRNSQKTFCANWVSEKMHKGRTSTERTEGLITSDCVEIGVWGKIEEKERENGSEEGNF